MVSRINLYVAFVFCWILFVVEAYPEKRHGKKIQFLSCISISYNYKPLDLRAYFALNMNSLLINLKKRRGICTKFGKKLGRLQVTSARHKFSYRSVGQPNLWISPGGVLKKVLYGEAPPRAPTPYPFTYHFFQKRHPFRIPFIGKRHPFHIPS